jgi:predicted ATP-grasp superfamily ATP-dependent carboligase
MSSNDRQPDSIRVLLCEGSSLSAREAISALGPRGYVLDVCDPDPRCLGRFSRFVRAFYRCPPAGTDPHGYLQFLLQHLKRVPYDVLLPVQEQAFLFSRVRDQLQPLVGLAVTEFGAFERLQSKVGFLQVLDYLGLPHPQTAIMRTRSEIEAWNSFPYYLKSAYGTASSSVWLITTEEERAGVIEHVENIGWLNGTTEFLIQEIVQGPLCMVQAIFDQGRLIGLHCWQRLREGARGSSSSKMSIDQPLVRQHIERLGAYLRWHGSLSIDYLLDPGQSTPLYIDANPRLVECMNATFSGLNLAEMQVRLSLAESFSTLADSHPGIRSHMLMMALLHLASKGGRRWDVLHEIWQALRRKDVYASSQEELTMLKTDIWSGLPLALVIINLLINPVRGRAIAGKAVSSYSLTPAAIQTIRDEM